MLAKLAFVMQRLKKYLKNLVRGRGRQFLDFMGAHSCYEGDIELMGVLPVPPLGKILPGIAVFGRSAVVSPAFKKQFYKELQTPFLIENNNKNNRTIEKTIEN